MSTIPTTPLRRIAHLDMDAFYASVELLRYPQLRGLPVVIGGGQREGARAPAQQIQGAIQQHTGLSCSLGVAPNKLIAKMASEFRKPSGISIVYESQLVQKIWPLPCRKISGIGPKASAQLEQLGIRTIGELAGCERRWLVQHFGPNHGTWMHESAWGRDDRPVVTKREPVSMSRETTFDRDLHAVRDRDELRALFTDLCQRLALDLQRHGYVGKTIGIKLRYDNFQRATREQTIELYTSDAAMIRRAAGQCLKRAPLERRLRLLGVKVAGLVRREELEARTLGAARLPAAMPLF